MEKVCLIELGHSSLQIHKNNAMRFSIAALNPHHDVCL